ncbi:MAG: accessory regulator AgrB [Alkaliphilus sp.]|nr:accessory gene regulator B family protein [bacterium AH-315-G05]PHS36271.1 MAG: accessory regulator AgrB [Alkaliphilus sp.]
MIDYLSNMLINKFKIQSIIQEEDEEVYFYGLQLLIATIIKIVGLIVIASILGFVVETIVFMVFYSSLRVQAGGFHASTFFKCLIITMIIISISLVIAYLIPHNYASNMQLIILVIAILLVYLYAPVDTENKPLSKKEVLIYRRRSMITVLIGSTIILTTIYLYNELMILGNVAALAFFSESVTLTPLFQKKPK